MLKDIHSFLACETPAEWLERALDEEQLLLIDHANCEKKAAATAMNLMYRHTEKADLLTKMSQLAREELLHFQQVVELMRQREIRYVRLSPSRYASGLRSLFNKEDNNQHLVDTLIAGAFIEARSCERFEKLVPLLDKTLGNFYGSLLKSESRHYRDYLELAYNYSDSDMTARVNLFGTIEAELITSKDTQFRFHSGLPA